MNVFTSMKQDNVAAKNKIQ